MSQEGSMRNKNILVSVLETYKKRRNFDYVKRTWIVIWMPMLSYHLNHTSMHKKMNTFLKVPFDSHLKNKCFSNSKYMCLCLSWCAGQDSQWSERNLCTTQGASLFFPYVVLYNLHLMFIVQSWKIWNFTVSVFNSEGRRQDRSK